MREETIQSILNHKLIVIVRGVPVKSIVRTAEAMVKGGIRLLEITFDAQHRERNEETAEAIRLLNRTFSGVLRVGAGTVLSPLQLQMAQQAGAEYIISPDTNEEIIRRTQKCGLVSIPGAMTPTEIQTAHAAGADFVKVFPVSSLGASYIRAVCAPLSHIRLLAVGSVSPENLMDYLEAGAVGAGIGGKIVDPQKIAQGQFEELTERAKHYTRLISAQKKEGIE